MKRLIRYEYARPGKGTSVFEQWLLLDRPDVKVLLLEEHAGRRLQIESATVLDPGAPALWFVFPGAWHDVGRFHRRDGTFTGWYTNLCTPVELRGDTWSSTDLFLDHWLTPSGDHRWLDEPEFLSAVGTLIDDRTHARVISERNRIDEAMARHDWPPLIARELDLNTARGLMPSES